MNNTKTQADTADVQATAEREMEPWRVAAGHDDLFERLVELAMEEGARGGSHELHCLQVAMTKQGLSLIPSDRLAELEARAIRNHEGFQAGMDAQKAGLPMGCPHGMPLDYTHSWYDGYKRLRMIVAEAEVKRLRAILAAPENEIKCENLERQGLVSRQGIEIMEHLERICTMESALTACRAALAGAIAYVEECGSYEEDEEPRRVSEQCAEAREQAFAALKGGSNG